jgi:hypothetical protein
MIMRSEFRNVALTVHVTSSVGFLGAVAGFLALAIAGLTSQDVQVVRAAYVANGLLARFVIVPLCFASLLTGLVMSLGTRWGLFRYYWVLVKLLLTTLTTLVLLNQMAPISHIAAMAAEAPLSAADFRQLRSSLVVHAGAGLLVLLMTTTLSICKPRGMTRYGWRKQQV